MNIYAKSLVGGSALTVAVLGILAQAQATPYPVEQDKIVFSCEMQYGEYVTMEKLVRETVNPVSAVVMQQEVVYENPLPLIAWTATLDSDHPKGEYIPKSRCEAVSARLTNLASAFGLHTMEDIGLLSMVSDVGKANSQGVIYVSFPIDTKASTDKVIFTLKPENRLERKQVLTQFQIGVLGGVGGPDLPVEFQPPIVE